MKIMLSILIIICILPIVSSDLFPTPTSILDIGINNEIFGVDILIPKEIFNSSSADSNSSNFWTTLTFGILRDVNSTQFDNLNQVLNIDESYIDSNWCRLTGCIMTGDIDMNGNGLTGIQYLDFNLTADVVSQEGRVAWNDDDKTLNIGTDISGVTLQMGQEIHLRVFNNAGRDFFNGDVVFIDGAQGQRPTIELAISSNSSRSRLIGLLTHDCSDSSNCIVTTGGIVRDLDTSSFSAGDMLYLSSTQEGNFTSVSPVAPSFPILVGIVLNSNVNEGKVLVSTGPTDVVNDMVIQGLTINTNLTVGDSIFFQDSDHFLRRGALGFDGLATNAFAFQQNIEHPEGTVPFIVTANKTNSDNDAVLIMAQIGLNESNSILGNSWIVVVNNLTNNLTEFSKCFLVAGLLNETLRVQCDSSDSGADFIVQDDIQSFGTMFADGGIRAETLVDFIMNGEDVNIQGGALHIFTPVTFEQGVVEGNEVTVFIESFGGGLGSFVNLQDDLGNWFVTSNILCDDGDCANAIGISSAGNIIMEANISTVNINSTSLNFIYSLVNIIGANDIEVTVNNNIGSGEVSIFTDSTNNVVKSSQSITLPSSMSNQPKVSIRFNCDVTNTNRQCFVDTISVNGTAIATTLTNVSGFNSVWKMSDGTLAADGFPERGIFYVAENDTIVIRGNATFENIIEQDLNVTSSITLDGTTIFNWGDIPDFFKLDGSTPMEGAANWDGFDLNNVGRLQSGAHDLNGDLEMDSGSFNIFVRDNDADALTIIAFGAETFLTFDSLNDKLIGGVPLDMGTNAISNVSSLTVATDSDVDHGVSSILTIPTGSFNQPEIRKGVIGQLTGVDDVIQDFYTSYGGFFTANVTDGRRNIGIFAEGSGSFNSINDWAGFFEGKVEVTGDILLSADMKNFFLGAAQDVSISFDSVDLIINNEGVTGNVRMLNTNFDSYNFDNNVGINMNSPTHYIQIHTVKNSITGSNIDVSELSQIIQSPGDNTGRGVGIGFGVSSSLTQGAAIVFEREGAASFGKLHFATKPSGGTNDIPIRMTIESNGDFDFYDGDLTTNGDVFIGGKLNVSESIEFNGTLITHSPFITCGAEEDICFGVDFSTRTTDWCEKVERNWVCDNSNSKILEKLNIEESRNNARILLAQEKADCFNNGYSWDGECFEMVKTSATRNEAITMFMVNITENINSICERLDNRLEFESYNCTKIIPTTEQEESWKFNDDCNRDRKNGLYCQVRELR